MVKFCLIWSHWPDNYCEDGFAFIEVNQKSHCRAQFQEQNLAMFFDELAQKSSW